MALAVAAPAWLLLSAQADSDLAAAQAREAELRQAYTAKLAQAAQVEPLQRRRQALREWEAAQQRRIEPGRAETLEAALHQSALRHGLQVELMRPEPAQPHAVPALVPVTLRLVGRYDALGAFAADVAALQPPVALHDLQLAAARDAGLVLEATARALAQPADADKAVRPAEARP
ncbi:type IV pilus inner membrane component PilO [Azohydromonas lata]|uniref:Type 4a pilus biogenesis protein PilO n=1 Tax=Azohydromonas lata TaxID=45677 RepID=A0ABU5I8J7_9BURK|nr:type 4a pilus biogenesis protein PilO [Azohydromonas lata]MDZ5455419.1 type 4a pilus biogenesis protein PilO [Azohydromonas lata]